MKTYNNFDILGMRSAWIAPNGDLHRGTGYRHPETIAEIVPKFQAELKAFKENEKVLYEEYQKQFEPDEHQEWHVFDTAQNDRESILYDRILKEAYEMGYVRLGIITSENVVRVEGLFDRIMAQQRVIEKVKVACEERGGERFIVQIQNYK